ncbi:MAG TPA: FecR family protein [Pyrinomonadaceae bacterium]|jgi:hypothetical protein
MKSVPGKFLTGLLVFISVLCASVFVQAQNREKFVISAKAGGVNAVTGSVEVKHRGAAKARLLTSKDNLDSGDLVQTGSDGRVEVLLNPGSYLRVPENSVFELADASLEGLRVRLIKGSAIIEAATADGVEVLIQIETPQTKVAIVRGGLYRLNLAANGTTEVFVRKGRALVGPSLLVVKGGKKVAVGAGSPLEVAKFDKKEQDELDLWSKERAETLAEANRKFSRRSLMAIYSSFDDSYWSSYMYPGRSGFWAFNNMLRCFTFIPFYPGWGSPYGRSYSSAFYYNGRWTDRWYGINRAEAGKSNNGGGSSQRVNPPHNSGGGAGNSGGPGMRPIDPGPMRRSSGDDGGMQRIKPSDPDRFRGEDPVQPSRSPNQ